MNYQIKMMSGDKYWISQKEFEELAKIKEKGLVYIRSIKGMINFSSVESIIREDKISLENKNEVELDGFTAIRRFGTWVCKDNPNVRIDLKRYPQLAKDDVESVKLLKK